MLTDRVAQPPAEQNSAIAIAAGMAFAISTGWYFADASTEFHPWYLVPYFFSVVFSSGIAYKIASRFPPDYLVPLRKIIITLLGATVATIILSGQVAALTLSAIGVYEEQGVLRVGLMASLVFVAEAWPVLVLTLLLGGIAAYLRIICTPNLR